MLVDDHDHLCKMVALSNLANFVRRVDALKESMPWKAHTDIPKMDNEYYTDMEVETYDRVA